MSSNSRVVADPRVLLGFSASESSTKRRLSPENKTCLKVGREFFFYSLLAVWQNAFRANICSSPNIFSHHVVGLDKRYPYLRILKTFLHHEDPSLPGYINFWTVLSSRRPTKLIVKLVALLFRTRKEVQRAISSSIALIALRTWHVPACFAFWIFPSC